MSEDEARKLFEVLLNEDEKKLRDEVRGFVRDKIDPALIIAMDSKEKEYPYEFIKAAAGANLLGLRFPEKYGGRDL
ncbi:MAG: acyl-CoA dehydrogenase family protein, partial [Promethearchaeota archaeon]